ncbi:MAG: tRNA 2-thiouridine(34) synthase MnmA [Deltaproteobacteria bacterium]|nr:tRNA 2-thiouridine(34) synthase MnmA [Deltaproteobacteria bacterium]
MNTKKVILGMSGGVDSSVAACLLQKEGFEVLGVSMELYSCDRPTGKGCCTPADRLDARRICERLGISFDIIDLRKPFKEEVMTYFATEYSKGRTPLPCAPCNSKLRFKALLDYADSVGAKWISTGHYARVRANDDGTASLLRGVDLKKDQSYFLWGLGQDVLQRLQFPIGAFNKEKVREKAREFGLVTSEKKDSQELCFVGDEDHVQFLENHFPESALPAGDFLDESGKKMGRHRGVHAYTIGQRRGLGVSTGERRYVVSLDAKKNEIILGGKESLKATGLIAKDPHWIDRCPTSDVRCTTQVRIRSTHAGVGARVETTGSDLTVHFETPQETVTPGQAAVLYQNEVCLGGAWIEKAIH